MIFIFSLRHHYKIDLCHIDGWAWLGVIYDVIYMCFTAVYSFIYYNDTLKLFLQMKLIIILFEL